MSGERWTLVEGGKLWRSAMGVEPLPAPPPTHRLSDNISPSLWRIGHCSLHPSHVGRTVLYGIAGLWSRWTAAIGADESTPSSLICRPIVFRAASAMGPDERRWLAWASQGKEVGLRSGKVTNKRPHLPQLGAAVQSDHWAGVAPPLIRVVWVREAQAICKSARCVNHFPSPVPPGASAR